MKRKRLPVNLFLDFVFEPFGAMTVDFLECSLLADGIDNSSFSVQNIF